MSVTTRDDILRLIESPDFSAEIILILRRNEEAITENSNGYFFEFAKLKDNTLEELTNLIQKFDTLTPKEEAQDTLMLDHSQDVNSHETDQQSVLNKTSQDNMGSFIKISQKFINEYTLDAEKTAGKPLSILKFMNSRKKYLRNAETLLSKFNEPALRKEAYIIN
tara:strand:- start:922 stop:1416 length:495 start_codon:yes stop_codon:yes gene_type:complete